MKIAMIFMIFFLVLPEASSQEEGSFRIMFWNAENVFDIFNDSATDDDDFLPAGVMRWNKTRYSRKINSMYKTIMAAGEWSPPAIIAFCEIENRKVLEDLIHGTYLSKYNYGIIHEDSPDRRGIDVCLIYRKDSVRLVNFEYWSPQLNGREFTSRNVLYSRMICLDDTLHLIVNHWPSRRGGVLSGEDLRLEIASMVRNKADSIVGMNGGNAKIIITGDFNCTPGDSQISRLTAGGEFINLSGGDPGTYRYQGTWETIDQFIVSEALHSGESGLWTGKSGVFRMDFLLTEDSRYPGLSPFSTYRGYRYQGGFSDHLPVLIDLYRKKP